MGSAADVALFSRWVSIALFLLLLGLSLSKSWAFHTSINGIGSFNDAKSMTTSNDELTDSTTATVPVPVPVPVSSFKRWIGNKRKIRRQRRRQRRQRRNHHEEQHQKTYTPVPHAGCHFFPYSYRKPLLWRLLHKVRRRQRFMEGWYYRLTLKDYTIDEDNSNTSSAVSFALIISIEDPGIKSSDFQLSCLQAIGPNDQYLVQATRDDTEFWASRQTQSLGCIFEKYGDESNTDFEKGVNNVVNNDDKIDRVQLKESSSAADLQFTTNKQKNYNSRNNSRNITTCLDPYVWKESVRSGFQIVDDPNFGTSSSLSPQPRPRWMGRINGHDGSKGGVLYGQGVQGTMEFDFTVDPDSVCGYGGYTTNTINTTTTTDSYNSDITTGASRATQKRRRNHNAQRQKSTGGWLSSFPVFEPHWQVTMADALATGSVVWNGTKYGFENQPFYAEKNWGDALPSKWYWTQCNSFDNNEDELSVTGGGGIRKLPFGREEELGMIAVHYKGKFYEAVPWKGNVEWNVSTWGEWSLYGDRLEETIAYDYDFNDNCDTSGGGGGGGQMITPPFAVEVRYRCDPVKNPGLVFRAPTKNGMVPFCRDTFEADCELTLWELKQNETTNEYDKVEPPIINRAISKEGGAEIGGGPWWSDWHGKSQLKPIIKTLLNFPDNIISR